MVIKPLSLGSSYIYAYEGFIFKGVNLGLIFT